MTEERKPLASRRFKQLTNWGIGIGTALAIIFAVAGATTWLNFNHKFHEKAEKPPSLNNWGDYGSYLQGTTASLWALAGFCLIFVAFLAQKQQLISQDEDLEEQRQQFQQQHESIKRQNFENTFFQMLNLHHKLVDGMEARGGDVRGRECFARWYRTLQEDYHNQLRGSLGAMKAMTGEPSDHEFAVQVYEKVYASNQNSLGHYFRNLYHIIKFVDESKDIEDSQKRRYTSLTRAQLSQTEQALFFYNGIHPVSEDFWKLIEKYGLLHNLDTERLLLDDSHEAFYDPKAYAGSGKSGVPSPRWTQSRLLQLESLPPQGSSTSQSQPQLKS